MIHNTMPVTRSVVIAAEHDWLTPTKVARRMVDVLPDGELQLFAPEFSVPDGQTLSVQFGGVLGIESVDPGVP